MLEKPRGQHRQICKLLGTNVTELAEILGKSRQTITTYLDEDKLFDVKEVITVASRRFKDEAERARVVSEILAKYFRDVFQYTRDTNVERFSTYCIFGMYIQPEIIENEVFHRFIENILSNEKKFVVFVCLPQKQYVQLHRWLDTFKDKKGKTASYVVLPCRLVELAPIQVLAEPWSETPKLIHFNRNEIFVDEANAVRASQLAGALKEYGVSRQDCTSVGDEAVAQRLVRNLNNSYYDPKTPVTEKPIASPRKDFH